MGGRLYMVTPLGSPQLKLYRWYGEGAPQDHTPQNPLPNNCLMTSWGSSGPVNSGNHTRDKLQHLGSNAFLHLPR